MQQCKLSGKIDLFMQSRWAFEHKFVGGDRQARRRTNLAGDIPTWRRSGQSERHTAWRAATVRDAGVAEWWCAAVRGVWYQTKRRLRWYTRQDVPRPGGRRLTAAATTR